MIRKDDLVELLDQHERATSELRSIVKTLADDDNAGGKTARSTGAILPPSVTARLFTTVGKMTSALLKLNDDVRRAKK